MSQAGTLDMMNNEQTLTPKVELLRMWVAATALLAVGLMTSPVFETIHSDSLSIRMLPDTAVVEATTAEEIADLDKFPSMMKSASSTTIAGLSKSEFKSSRTFPPAW